MIELSTVAPQLLPQLEHPALGLLAYGSSVEGLANSASDLDLLAPTQDIRSLQLIHLDDTPVHVEFVPISELQRELDGLDLELRMRSFDFNLITLRLRRSVILHDPTGALHLLREKALQYKPSDLTRHKFRAQARGLLHDALGAARDGQMTHALLLTHLAVHIASAAELLDRGETHIGLKWQHRWLERMVPADDQEWWTNYQVAFNLPAPEQLDATVLSALKAARRLIERGPGYDR